MAIITYLAFKEKLDRTYSSAVETAVHDAKRSLLYDPLHECGSRKFQSAYVGFALACDGFNRAAIDRKKLLKSTTYK